METKFIQLDTVQSDKYNDDGTQNPCLCCGKEVKTEKYFVHLCTDGNLTSEEDENKIENSQGLFPIGSECRKKLPKEFVFSV